MTTSGEKQREIDAVEGLADDLSHAEPGLARILLKNERSHSINSEQAHQIAAEAARQSDRKYGR